LAVEAWELDGFHGVAADESFAERPAVEAEQGVAAAVGGADRPAARVGGVVVVAGVVVEPGGDVIGRGGEEGVAADGACELSEVVAVFLGGGAGEAGAADAEVTVDEGGITGGGGRGGSIWQARGLWPLGVM
jgi:hypothetical protein